jgi:PiT family inorganic phosphate transporter
MGMLLFLSSGLFLGWSLGANDAANVFGTAVGTRMVRFRTAALVCSVFIVLGAVISGAGAAHTLGRLGAVDALAGSFTVALAAALTTYAMTRLKIPVSTSQAIVGAIIGWNFYTAAVTDTGSLTRIVVTWVACPLLSAAVAVVLLAMINSAIRRLRPHLLVLDAWTRFGLLAVGAFGSYSLGANNIANVMGVFLPDNPFRDIELWGVTISGAQLLFALGGVAIGVGVFTYSQRVMGTVGGGLLQLSPVAALVVVLAHSITLFLFASERLEHFLASHGLPTFPLVPVSSSQAVIGAIIGIGLLKGGRGIRYGVLGEISLGWAATPLLAGLASFLLLFVVENVFAQRVNRDLTYRVDAAVVAELGARGITDEGLATLDGRVRTNATRLKHDLLQATQLSSDEIMEAIEAAQLGAWRVDEAVMVQELDPEWFSAGQLAAVKTLAGRRYERSWQLRRDLAAASAEWKLLPRETINRIHNQELEAKLSFLEQVFRVDAKDESPMGSEAPVGTTGSADTTPN